MTGRSDWASKDYFWIAVIGQGVLATCGPPYAYRVLRANRLLTVWSCLGTAAIILPPVQSWMDGWWRQPGDLHTAAILPAAYLLVGHYRTPSLAYVFSGTYFSFLIADFLGSLTAASIGQYPADRFYLFIGGGGIRDGLVLALLAATAVALLLKLVLATGHRFDPFGVRSKAGNDD
jgi:hypothetical protein